MDTPTDTTPTFYPWTLITLGAEAHWFVGFPHFTVESASNFLQQFNHVDGIILTRVSKSESSPLG